MSYQPNEKVTRLESAKLTVKHLLNNGASHETPFSAIAELVDNAYDANAKNLHIDIRGEHPSERIEILDDGTGMSRAEALNIIKFGFSEKDGCDIGRYGNGLKSGGFHLGRDMLLLTKKNRVHTAVFISNSFLDAQNCRDTVYVPCPSMDPEGNMVAITKEEIKRYPDECEFINQYEEYHGGELKELFHKIPGDHGTLVIISKLQRTAIGELKINIKADRNDIRIDGDNLPDHKSSLRAYLQILYLHPKITIHLRESLVHPTKVLSGWIGRCQRDIPCSPFNEGLNEIISKYEVEKKKLRQKREDLITDNARFNKEDIHILDRREEKSRIQMALDANQKEIETRDQWIDAAKKSSKESKFRSYFGVNIENRDEFGIHFYINNRLIIWGYKSPFFKKTPNTKGIAMYNELDFRTFRPTHNKQGFSSAKDFNSLVKQCDKFLQAYHCWVEKIWLPTKHLKVTDGDIWETLWDKYGYNNRSKEPSEEQRMAMKKETGYWRLCLKCRKWKRLTSLDNLNGSSHQTMFDCRNVPGQACGNAPNSMVSDAVVAMLLPDKAKVDEDIRKQERMNRLVARPPREDSLPSVAPFRSSAPPPLSPNPSSCSSDQYPFSIGSRRNVTTSEPTAPAYHDRKPEHELIGLDDDDDFGTDFGIPTESSSNASRHAREEVDIQGREQRIHASKPSEKVSRRRIYCSDDEDDDDLVVEEPPKKSKPSTSNSRPAATVRVSAASRVKVLEKELQQEREHFAALASASNVLLDYLDKSATHRLRIPSGSNGMDRMKKVINQVLKLKKQNRN